MPFITEVSPIFIQRFYTGLITLRNQLLTPVKFFGRRVIELYDALLAGQNWEVTPRLSLKRRAGHTAYVTIASPAQLLYSWKSNTMGTIPIIDTTTDIEYVNSGGTTTQISAKTGSDQSSILGIGNYLYVGNPQFNFKWDGPAGPQGKTNWGITFTSAEYGPTVCTTGTDAGGPGVAWTNPANVTDTGSNYATVTVPVGNVSHILEAGGFGFSIPAGTSINGVQVSAKLAATGGLGGAGAGLGAYVNFALFNASTGYFGAKARNANLGSSPVSMSIGGPNDNWAGTLNPNNLNGADFFVFVQLINGGNGNTITATAQINDLRVTIFAGLVPTATPTGSGTFSAINGFTYVYAYGNSRSGEISNASVPSLNTGPFSGKAYVGIPVTASTDTQVDQIRVYRTTDSGGGNEFFEISNSPFANSTVTVQDITPDTSLQVTSQAEINLGNTPPPAGLINLAWFAGRMWGSVNNLLFASTGAETISGTAPNSNWNPAFQYVIPSPITRIVAGPNGLIVFTLDDCYIVRGTDIPNFTINEFIKDFGVRSYNCVDTDGTDIYVFTSDRQFIQLGAAGANDYGSVIADQLALIDPNSAYVKVNRSGLDSIVRILDTVNNIYFDFNINQQCWNLPGVLAMPACTAMGSIETAPAVWRLLLTSTSGGVSQLAYRDLTNFQDLGSSYIADAVFGTIQLANPGTLAKFGARGGMCLQYTTAGQAPTLSVLPNDAGVDLSQPVGSQILNKFVSLNAGKNPVPWPPVLGNEPTNYRSLGYYWLMAKGLSAYLLHLQFRITAPAENTATELIGMGIFGDEKGEAMQGRLPELQGR